MHEFTCEDALAFVADSRIGMALVDPDFRFVAVNTAYCKILNAPRELVIGHRFVEFTHAEDIELDVQFAEKLKRGEAPSYEFAKRYIRRGSTPQKQLIVWGLLRVEAVWSEEKPASFRGYRVTFEPFDSERKIVVSVQKLKDAFAWVVKNWKTIATIAVIAGSITGIGGGQLLELLKKVQQAKSSVDSVLESSSSDSPSP